MLVIERNKIYTESDDKLQWYGERITKRGNKWLREFDPKRSKIASAIKKGLRVNLDNKSILYLGCSTGTTVSHLSDLTKNTIIGVDIAPVVMREFLLLSEARPNVVPLLWDASKLDEFKELQNQKFDLVFQDIAQRNMVETFINNVKRFGKSEGWLSLKTRSIDSTKPSKIVFENAKSQLIKAGLIVDKIFNLEPFERDHYFFVVKLR